jgi:hypothetical protein
MQPTAVILILPRRRLNEISEKRESIIPMRMAHLAAKIRGEMSPKDKTAGVK